jgi:hypothetical protein
VQLYLAITSKVIVENRKALEEGRRKEKEQRELRKSESIEIDSDLRREMKVIKKKLEKQMRL